jgi:hypothetical protein
LDKRGGGLIPPPFTFTMNTRLIDSHLAIKTVREYLELFDLPYKEIGYENIDYSAKNIKPNLTHPVCYTFRFHTVNYIHIMLNEEKYIMEDGFNYGDYWKTFTNIIELKMFISKISVNYKESMY